MRLGAAFLVLYAVCALLWINHIVGQRHRYSMTILYGDSTRRSLERRIAEAKDDHAATETLEREHQELLERTQEARTYRPKVREWEEGLLTVGGITVALYVGAAIVMGGRQGLRDPI